MTDDGFRLFYRIVITDPPTRIDFTSNAARKGQPLNNTEDARLWDGLSVYSTFNQARRKQRISPILGGYIATVRIPLDGSVTIERTRGEGHHTLWGDPEMLVAMVVSVTPRS